ncbi:MAG: Crp/Fnr family transcriptional regulator [Anaerolineae bacterium]|nr:Crp/Fnr family transcriptional regulator [Anaerolineae bacterium]
MIYTLKADTNVLIPHFQEGSDDIPYIKSRTSTLYAVNNHPTSILFAGLSREQIEIVGRAMRISPYARRDFVFHTGETAESLYIVYEGVVKKVYTNARGDEQILGIFQAGDIFGELFLGKYEHRIGTASAVTSAVVASLTRDDLERLIEQIPRIGINFIQHLADEQRETLARMHAMRQANARNRLMGTLLTLARRSYRASGEWFGLPPGITQGDIANVAGLNRSTASLLINELRRDGILGGTGRLLTVNRKRVEHILETEGLEILE